MIIKNYAKIRKTGDKYTAFYHIGKGASARNIELELEPEEVEKALIEPIESINLGRAFWVFKNYLLCINERYLEINGFLNDENILRIKYFVLKKEKEFNKISKEVEAFERMAETETAKREKISDSVKLFVWQRDEGMCVKCGTKEKLEFDHIIPVVNGGSSTERNIQILCEPCNRSKNKNVV